MSILAARSRSLTLFPRASGSQHDASAISSHSWNIMANPELYAPCPVVLSPSGVNKRTYTMTDTVNTSRLIRAKLFFDRAFTLPDRP